MNDMDKINELNRKIENSPKALRALSAFVKIVAVIIGVVSIALLFIEPIAGIIFLVLAIFIWFAGKNMKGQAKEIKGRKSFEFPQTDGHGHKLLTVYDMNVTGVMREHDGIDPQTIISKLHEGEQLLLEADPDNEYDSNAVKVKTIRGIQIGWLPQGENLQIDIADRLNNGQTVYARAKKRYLLDNYPGEVGLVIDVARYAKSSGGYNV